MSDISPIQTLDTMQGNHFTSIQAASTIFQRHKLDLAHYKITLVRDGTALVVMFTDKDGEKDTHKTVGVREGANIEMSAHDVSTLIAHTSSLKTLDVVQGSSLAPIQAASTIFQRHKLDLAHYKITLVRDGTALVVMFTDKDAKPGGRGSLGTHPGFEVEMDSHGQHVLKSYFVR